MRRAAWAILLAVFAPVVSPGEACAHPHAWIDVHSAVIFDPGGKITAVEEEWSFDEQYSAFNLQPLAPDQRDSPAALTALMEKNLARIAPLGYFTTLRAGDKPVAASGVSGVASEMRGKRLWLRFTLSLATPVDPRARLFSYWIGDPTYWIEMVHRGIEPVVLRGKRTEGCSARIEPPHPTPELLARAAALDVDAKVDPSLGQFFAETVRISCAPEAAR